MHGIPTAGCNPFSVFFGWFLVWLFVFGLFVLVWFVFLFWFVLSLMGLLTGLCIGPLPALLRLLTQLTALQANYNSACLLRLNVCNDLAKAMKALDGKKRSPQPGSYGASRQGITTHIGHFEPNNESRVAARVVKRKVKYSRAKVRNDEGALTALGVRSESAQ